MNKASLCVLALIVFLFALSDYALAASATAVHVVTVRVEPFAVISLVGGSRANSASLVVDGKGVSTASRQLRWSTNLEGMRVTVQSNLPTNEQDYILRVRTVHLNSKGRSRGWVIIDERASTLITGVGREVGGCSLEYEASPKIAGKTGCDEHIITYTITE